VTPVPRPVTIGELLRTADLLLAGGVEASAASRYRGASLALRTALEIAVNRAVEAQVAGLAQVSMRARMLCLRFYTDPETARRANAMWSHVCLACHYHRYEIGPTHAQVVAWRHEVAALIPLLVGS
jgi:hypothetical protein